MKKKNWSSFSSSSSHGCTRSLKAAVFPKLRLRGPSPKRNPLLQRRVLEHQNCAPLIAVGRRVP
jgi:hypothetical protein